MKGVSIPPTLSVFSRRLSPPPPVPQLATLIYNVYFDNTNAMWFAEARGGGGGGEGVLLKIIILFPLCLIMKSGIFSSEIEIFVVLNQKANL